MSEISALIKGLNQTFCGERVRVSGLVNSEMVLAGLVITAGLFETNGTIIKAISHVCEGFSVVASSDAWFICKGQV